MSDAAIVGAAGYGVGMARWDPNARERLQAAALELFEERGYDGTTVGDIAARACLTERTFFRHFADKREVLFAGADAFEALITSVVEGLPRAAPPLEVVVALLASSSPFFETRRGDARRRQAVIAAHAELRERELMKSTRLAATLVAALCQRGVAEPTASLVAQTGLALFRTAYGRWLEDGEQRDLAHHLRETLDELRRLTAEVREPPE